MLSLASMGENTASPTAIWAHAVNPTTATMYIPASNVCVGRTSWARRYTTKMTTAVTAARARASPPPTCPASSGNPVTANMMATGTAGNGPCVRARAARLAKVKSVTDSSSRCRICWLRGRRRPSTMSRTTGAYRSTSAEARSTRAWCTNAASWLSSGLSVWSGELPVMAACTRSSISNRRSTRNRSSTANMTAMAGTTSAPSTAVLIHRASITVAGSVARPSAHPDAAVATPFTTPSAAPITTTQTTGTGVMERWRITVARTSSAASHVAARAMTLATTQPMVVPVDSGPCDSTDDTTTNGLMASMEVRSSSQRPPQSAPS